jgi:hypothetical protein
MIIEKYTQDYENLNELDKKILSDRIHAVKGTFPSLSDDQLYLFARGLIIGFHLGKNMNEEFLDINEVS